MIKIISISNTGGLFDGLNIYLDTLDHLKDVLSFTRFRHEIKYIDENRKTIIEVV